MMNLVWLCAVAGIAVLRNVAAIARPPQQRQQVDRHTRTRPSRRRVDVVIEPDFVRQATELEEQQVQHKPIENATGRLDCDPCIDRPTFHIKAITHGNRNSLFWLQVRSAALSAARLLRIELDFELYDAFDPTQMANDIEAAVNADVMPDALLVTIPSPLVHHAVQTALSKGVPVFGINSGSDVAQELGVLGFLAMDEHLGGVKAAEQFIKFFMDRDQNNTIRTNTGTRKALFVNHEQGNTALDARFQGFSQTLTAGNSNNSSNSSNTTSADFLVDQFFVDPSQLNSTYTYDQQMKDFETNFIEGCPYDSILLAGSPTLEFVMSALTKQGCFLPLEDGGTLLGTFDTETQVYDAIAVGKLHFAISQQQHLQGMLGVVFATLYATVEKRLLFTDDSSFGPAAPIFSTGPKIITLENIPPDTLQMCEHEAFPVCPDNLDPYGVEQSKCPCTDLSKIRIAAVLHGIETHPFWLGLVAQSYAAAADLGIELLLHLQEPLDDEEIIFSKMSNKIISLCREGVHGIVISIPSEAVVPAIKECMELKVPIMSVNSGAEIAAQVGMMHHIGQIEYNAGHEAGERMMALGMKQALCPHEAGNIGLIMRCSGFRDAVMKAQNTTSDVEWLGMPVLLVGGFDYAGLYLRTVEEEVAKLNASWDGLGILLGASMFVEYSLVLKEKYPSILIGTFDKEQIVYDSIASGDVLFGIDQGDYLQGYLPIWLLTLNAYTEQFLQNQYLASGPTFIDEPQPGNAIQCEADQFKVCPPPINHDYNRLTAVRPVGLALCAIVFLTSILCAGWTIRNRNNPVVTVSQPFFLVMLTFGTIVMSSAIIPLSFDDGIASVEGCSIACMAFPWLFTTGFTLIFGVLKIKLNRVNRLMEGARRFRRIEVKIWHVMLPLVGLLAINVSLMLAWTLVDPMYYTRVTGDCGEDDLSSYGICMLGNTKASAYFFGAVAIVNICALIMAVWEAYRARAINDSLSESTYIFWILGGMLQTSVVGVPLLALVSTIPVASYFVKTALLFVNSMSTLALIFIPKFNKWRMGWSRRQLTVQTSSQREHSRDNRTTDYAHERSAPLNGSARSHHDDDIVEVPFYKVLKLEQLMMQRGINAKELFEEAELDNLLNKHRPAERNGAETALRESSATEKDPPFVTDVARSVVSESQDETP